MDTIDTQTGDVLTESTFLTSVELSNLAAALVTAQQSIGTVTKDKTANLGQKYSYTYANLAACLEAVREPLTKNGLCLVQGACGHGNAITVATRLLHKSGEWIESAITLTAKDASPQSIGSAITYGRRYGLSALVGLAAEDDDGKAAQPDRTNAQTARVAEPVKPAGYDEWLADMTALADEGMERLKAHWSLSRDDYRRHLTAHDSATWERIKTKASQQVPA